MQSLWKEQHLQSGSCSPNWRVHTCVALETWEKTCPRLLAHSGLIAGGKPSNITSGKKGAERSTHKVIQSLLWNTKFTRGPGERTWATWTPRPSYGIWPTVLSTALDYSHFAEDKKNKKLFLRSLKTDETREPMELRRFQHALKIIKTSVWLPEKYEPWT